MKELALGLSVFQTLRNETQEKEQISRGGKWTVRTALCTGTHLVTEFSLADPSKQAKAGKVQFIVKAKVLCS